MRIRKKDKIVVTLFLLLLCLGIGYAYLTTNLSINGTSDITRASWDIHFQSLEPNPNSTATVNNQAALNAEANTVTYAVTLSKPGDFYEFTVEAKNFGTIDGMISSINSKLNGTALTTLPDYLEYYVTYFDDYPLEPNHLLAAGTGEHYKVHIGYKDDISANQLPATAQNLTLSFGVTYNQANNHAVQRPYYVFTVSSTTMTIGSPIPNGVQTNTSPYNVDEDIFLRHLIIDNKIAETYIVYVYDQKFYYFKGGDNGLSYAANQEEAGKYSHYSQMLCQEDTSITPNKFYCSYPYLNIYANGAIDITESGGNNCHINQNGTSYCS